MATIVEDVLREYVEDDLGAAMLNGFQKALHGLFDIDAMDSVELCQYAEEMGIDFLRFEL